MMSGADRKQAILDYAGPLFAAKGIAGCTVRNIADGVGILSGSLYHHFDSKDAIVAAIVESYLEQLTDRYREIVKREQDPTARLGGIILASFSVGEDHPYASEIYQGNRNYFADGDHFARVRQLAQKVHDTWADVIASGVESGAFRADVNQRVFHRFLRDAVFMATRWFKPSEAYGLEELAADTAHIFFEGYTGHGVVPKS